MAKVIGSVDTTLAYIDQGAFLGLRALGRGPIIQYVWIYDEGIDPHGLRRFHKNLQHTLISRLIERSVLPFGRHRWVRYDAPDLDVEVTERPRDEVWDWVDERSFLPLDPEFGPPWHLGVQPLTGGGAAVSLVVAHTVVDAMAGINSIVDAVDGIRRDFGFPDKGMRTRRQALRDDLALTARSAREVPAAVLAAARLARQQQDDLSASAKVAGKPRSAAGDQLVVVPRVYGSVNAQEWGERAQALGGTRNILFAGLAVRVGYRLGRTDDDGRVLLSIPVSERTDGDTRANPLNGITVHADAGRVCTDLTALRSDFKAALVELGQKGAQILAPLPLTPFTPKFLLRRLESMVMKVGKPVGCTNIGDIPESANRPDGTDADFFTMRGGEAGLTPAILERLGGHLLVSAASVRDRVWFSVASWESDRTNTRSELSEVVAAAVADLGLTAQLQW